MNKATVRSVIAALKKASKAHAGQAAKLEKMMKGSNGKKTKSKRAIPTNSALYSRVKSEAKRKFKVYPSAYANAWLVKTYKKRGGGYRTG